ncbi:MAG: phenylalanine--tRNA ligase subunit beta [Gammaproteobacteria bacterium]|nr:phenylalanine--tRNA ligase subunit beta [Gammaproteobacteria bacterium]
MRFSEQWLREWVDPPVSTEELAHQLTMAGLEVDAVEPAAPPFSGVVVGEVRSVKPHPEAERLHVCRVAVGAGEPLPVVCGAPNVRAGMKAPLATVGATLPGGRTIEAARLRSVESRGMLCSALELGLAEEGEGLMALAPDAPAGEDLRSYLGLDDNVVELDLTPNRGDCLSVAGVAREVGVRNRVPVGGPPIEPVEPTVADTLAVELQADADCPRYAGRVIRGVEPRAPTPVWMQERLRRAGVRSISAVVDVTNYVMLELGQPMHAFDLAHLRGGIRVRRGRGGERLVLLDGREVELDSGALVIADHERPLALAGIMGGAGSAVGEETRDLFLESAFFTPEVVSGRARRYGLTTDSAHRFERGVDPALAVRAMERASGLLLDIMGGDPGPVIDARDPAGMPAPAPIRLRGARARALLGVELGDGEIAEILTRLGMEVSEVPGGWEVLPPSFRFDLGIEADLIEELGRIHGYQAIPAERPAGALEIRPRPERRLPLARLREALVDRGYQEAITYSFVDPERQRRLAPDAEAIPLANPLSREMAVMRTTLWPGLLEAVRHNQHRQQERVRLFECGMRFVKQGHEILQENVIAGAVTGDVEPEQWGTPARAADFYDLKSDVEALFTLTGRGAEFTFDSESHPALHPGQSARIARARATVGWLGALHPAIEQELELDGQVLLFELCLDPVQEGALPGFSELSRFPAIRRDIAVVVDEAVSAQALSACAARAAGDWLVELRVFDVYRGKGIESGRKSVAFGLILQDSSRTLTDDEADGLVERVVGELQRELGAALRE